METPSRPLTSMGRTIATAIVTLFLTSNPGSAADSLIRVSEFAWTSTVDNGDCTVRYSDMAPVQPIYLWMRLRGETAALETLRAKGKLPIRHKWFHSVGSTLAFEDSRTPIDAIPLTVGDVAHVEPLQVELKRRGYFDWRTWSMKQNIRPGTWVVRLVYADNTPVLCGDSPDDACQFSIDIQ